MLAATITIVVAWQNTVVTTLLCAALAIVANYEFSKRRIVMFVTFSLFATILESIAMSSGAWKYTYKHILNFPIWLPLYWGIGGLVIQDVYRVIERYVTE